MKQRYLDYEGLKRFKDKLDRIVVAALKSSISTAQSTANTAKTAANTAQSTANAAQTAANAAQSTANAAQTTANTAQSTANAAQTAVNGKCQIVTGSYAGTGKGGAGNPNYITLPFPPLVVMLFGKIKSGDVTYSSNNYANANWYMYLPMLSTSYKGNAGMGYRGYCYGKNQRMEKLCIGMRRTQLFKKMNMELHITI